MSNDDLKKAQEYLTTMTFDSDPFAGYESSIKEDGLYYSGHGKEFLILSEREARGFDAHYAGRWVWFRAQSIAREGELYQLYDRVIPDDDFVVTYCNKCWYETPPETTDELKSEPKGRPCPECGNPNFSWHFRTIPREYHLKKPKVQ